MSTALLVLSKVEADTEGHIAPQYRGQILATLRRHPNVSLDIEIRRHRSKRTSPQNRRHFALMRVGAMSLWEDPSEAYALHDELAHMYFALPPCSKTGLRRRRRTPNTDTKEFAEFTDWCAMKLVELGADLSAWDEETRRMAA